MNDDNENKNITQTQGSNKNEENLENNQIQETLNLQKNNLELEFDDYNEGIQPLNKKSIILSNLPKINNDINSDMCEKKLNRMEELEKIELRKAQASLFEKYLGDTGISSAFELIFSEMLTKKIPSENHFTYTAGRLRQIAREIETIKQKK